MAFTERLAIIIEANTQGVSRAFDDLSRKTTTIGERLDRVGSKMRSVGTKMTVGVTGPLLLLGKATSTAASDLEQSVGAIESVFGDAADKITAFGDTAAETAGLSKREVNEMAAVLGAQLQSMGRDADTAATEVIGLQTRAADLAATFGGETKDALEAISSLMRGERDPIEKYGVSIKQVDINARVMALGLETATAEQKKQSEATAALSLLLEQTAKVEGQFAREADTAAGAQARQTAATENQSASIGRSLLPIKVKLIETLGKLTSWFERLSPRQQEMIVQAGLLAAAIGPLTTVIGALIGTVKALGTAMAFLAANPVVLIIAAIAALAAGLVIAYRESETFRRIVDSVFNAIRRVVETVANAVTTALNWIIEHFDLVLLALGPVGAAVLLVKSHWDKFAGAIGWVVDRVKDLIGWLSKVPEAVDDALGPVDDLLGKIPGGGGGGLLEGLGRSVGGVFGLGGGVFHDGGIVGANLPRFPGLASDERMIVAQVGEEVVPRNRAGAGVTINQTNNFSGGMTAAELEAANRALAWQVR